MFSQASHTSLTGSGSDVHEEDKKHEFGELECHDTDLQKRMDHVYILLMPIEISYAIGQNVMIDCRKIPAVSLRLCISLTMKQVLASFRLCNHLTRYHGYNLTSVATAQLMLFSRNGYCVPNKISKFLEIFESIEGLKSRGSYFGPKKSGQPFLSY
jgi:hypothetical protein